MKRFRLFSLILIFFSLLTLVCGCAFPDASANGVQQSAARVYEIPYGVQTYKRAEVWADGTKLPLYSVQVNTSQTWSANGYRRVESGAALIELDGTVKITVKPDVQIDYSSKIRPLSAKLTPVANLEENTLTFTFKSAGNYVLEINGDKNNTINFFVTAYSQFVESGEYSNLIYFGAGLHTAENNQYIKADNTVTVGSNTLVYLDDGAVVRAKFLANNASHIAICGRGVIDGSTFDRDAGRDTKLIPIDFNYCKDVTLKDFFALDPAGWCVNFYFIENALIDNIKIITSRSNGDGISLQSCRDITVDGCFVRTWDDSLVVKNYPQWSDRSKQGATENILFKNCTLWTDLAQSMELGYETVGEKFEGVTFENITVLHALHLAPISIHNANNADIKNIVYKDITIEDAETPSKGAGVIDVRNLYSETWSTNHAITPLGSISNVSISNVKVISASRLSVVLGGCVDKRADYLNSEHWLRDITISDVMIDGVSPAQSECRISSTGYTGNFVYKKNDGSTEVTGARFIFSQSEEYLKKFNGSCKVELCRV